MRGLEEVAAEAAPCTRCQLAEGRTQVVFGAGSSTADLMVIGEAPGRDEDLQGAPFVGRSGQLLDRLLREELGIGRNEVYITNTVKCLRYNAQVQLGDGSWERIGRLVADRYSGEVMSLSQSGHLVPKRVVGWHRTPLAGRRVFHLTFKGVKRNGSREGGVELTGDHPVLTDSGWIEAALVTPGARVATGQGLSAGAFDVVCGSLLGDGHLNQRSACLAIGHSRRQAEYLNLKAQALAELDPAVRMDAVSAVAGGPQRHEVVVLRTRAHRALALLREEFYAPRKRIPSWLPDRLNPRMLAIWFMDDGNLRIRPGRRPSSELATCCFEPDELLALQAGLRRLALESTLGSRNRIKFGVDATKMLSYLIAPYVPPTMRYKLHPEAALAVPFDAGRYEPGPIETLYAEAVVTDVTEKPRTDVTFFCIDVEETHNFVTTGGVVHNCRPPSNRDPQPDEIASCRPWLEDQLDLVDPTVIVTLGNFATRLILNTREGITKMRGQEHLWNGRVVVPTFHPSAALRSGGGQVLAQMRADLVRAKLAIRRERQSPRNDPPASQ